MSIKICADSTCDLSAELVQKNDITIIPLYIVKAGQSYRDGIDITRQDIFDYVSANKDVCTTAAISVGDYLDFFTQQLQGHDGIVHFTISSDMSSCYQNAVMAAQELGNVYVVDARNLSTGIGHLVLDACAMAKQGMTAADIKAKCDELAQKLDVSFILDTLSYLHKGGRCSAVAALGANLLGLKPCIEVKNGKMGVGKKYRGALEKVLVTYVKERLSDIATVDTRRIFITHSGVSQQILDSVKTAVEGCADFDEILITDAGCTISNHCGPGCLGILFYRK